MTSHPTVRARLQDAVAAAMETRDRAALAVYRSALAALDNAGAVGAGDVRAGALEASVVGAGAAEVDRHEIGEDDAVALVAAEADDRRRAADAVAARNPDAADRLRAEAGLLDALLGRPAPEGWDDERAAEWVAEEATFDRLFTAFTTAVLDAAGIRPGARVLDVGCGTGTLLAAAVESGAATTGVDIAPAMVAAAQQRVSSATVVATDAQTADLAAPSLGGPFDVVVSRLGVMFFPDPVAAFANIRTATAPGGRLAFVCWRGLAENPMFTLGQLALAGGRADAVLPVEGVPGPMGFADPDRVRAVLADAGWSGVDVAALDAVADQSTPDSDGVEERLRVIMATSSGRTARTLLEPELGPQGWAARLDEVRADLRSHVVDGALRFPLAAWLVTARA
ncbi:class I SAM-dependent methyltransferase [Jatrophihabitans sp. YIM 134969]